MRLDAIPNLIKGLMLFCTILFFGFLQLFKKSAGGSWRYRAICKTGRLYSFLSICSGSQEAVQGGLHTADFIHDLLRAVKPEGRSRACD